MKTGSEVRARLLDEQWFCPNCGRKAGETVFFDNKRIIKCSFCGQFEVGIVYGVPLIRKLGSGGGDDNRTVTQRILDAEARR